MSTTAEPTADQLVALRKYAAARGRTWKADLCTDWSRSDACIDGERSAELQQVRNNLGPRWLYRFKLGSR